MATHQENPFRTAGTAVDAEHFTDRADEVARVLKTLRQPGAKLLVTGPRRMGKTSVLRRAAARLGETGRLVVMVDFSSASTLADMSTRLLQAAETVLGTRRRSAFADVLRHVAVGVKITPDPATGLLSTSLSLEQRTAPIDEQRQTLARVLDGLEAVAAAHKRPLGIIIDEFQEIYRFGGTDAEWHLRATIQHHQHLSYVLAGSREHLIRQMLGKNRAFYQLFERLAFGPIDAAHMATWIDARMRAHGVRSQGIGTRIVTLAGPRTRDIVELARLCFDAASPHREVRTADVGTALSIAIDETGDDTLARWDDLPATQQNVLRAVAAGEKQLYGAEALARYGLPKSNAVAPALVQLVKREWLVKAGRGYDFDSPFVRAWVITHALPDVGISVKPSELLGT
ncbi:MAG TPA: ATP-binding protein [Gemmatimonadaceae bacterium]|jgi:AAA+ ATPase superfamily predicted ATPase|nr:ATP-binding protein [Gemmatimonadaceae bacterium]